MAIPFGSHDSVDSIISTTISSETGPKTVSQIEVGTSITRTAAMIDAIVRIQANGTVSYHAPDSRTPSTWFTTLEGVLEGAAEGDTFSLPTVLIQPGAGNANIASISVADVVIMCNGAQIKPGTSTPSENEVIEPVSADLDTILREVVYGSATSPNNMTYDGSDWVATVFDLSTSVLTDIGDIPSISGEAGKLLKVNPTEDGYIWGDPSGTTVSWGDIAGPDISVQTDLQAELDAKAAASHTHTESEITDLGTYIEDITGELLASLSDVPAIDGKAGKLLKVNPTEDGYIWGDPAGTTVSWGDIAGPDISVQTDLQAALDLKANAADLGTYLTDITGEELADLSDIPAIAGSASKYLQINVAEDGYQWATPAAGTVVWGDLGGDIENQADLQAELDAINYQEVLVVGTDNATTDTAAMNAAIVALNALGGGVLRVRGTVSIDETLYFGSEGNTISLIGDGIGRTLLKLASGKNLEWRSPGVEKDEGFFTDVGYKTGAPSQYKEYQSIFNVDGHGLDAGDWVFIWSENYQDRLPSRHWSTDFPYEHLPGELVQVSQVPDVDTFYTESPVFDRMTTCRTRKMVPLDGIRIEGFDVMHLDNARSYFHFIGTKNLRCKDIRHVHEEGSAETTGCARGFRILSSCLFNIENIDFIEQFNTSSLGVIELGGFCSFGLIKNILSGTMAHHLDLYPHNRTTDMTEGVPDWADDEDYVVADMVIHGGEHYFVNTAHTSSTGVFEPPHAYYTQKTFISRCGTQRDITFRDWAVRHYNTGDEGNLGSHESGRGITIDNCTFDVTGGFSTRFKSRYMTIQNCAFRANGGSVAITLWGEGSVAQNNTIDGFGTGVVLQAPRCTVKDNYIRNCSRGVQVGSYTGIYSPVIKYAHNCTVANNIFANFTDDIQSSTNVCCHVSIKDGVLGARIVNNEMPRGATYYCIHVENPVLGLYGSIALCSGNMMAGWGDRDDGNSEAFVSGAEGGSPPNQVHAPTVAAAWQDENYLTPKAAVPSKTVVQTFETVSDYNGINYSQADWKLTARVNARYTGAVRHILSRAGGAGTDQRILWADVTNHLWYTNVGGVTTAFDKRLPGPSKIGSKGGLDVVPSEESYDITLEYDEGLETLTLTVNGESDTLTSIDMTDADGDFYIGTDVAVQSTGYSWYGDLGVRFESPPGNTIFEWPTEGI